MGRLCLGLGDPCVRGTKEAGWEKETLPLTSNLFCFSFFDKSDLICFLFSRNFLQYMGHKVHHSGVPILLSPAISYCDNGDTM
jgi:hypothetical protein